jgi:hypothetical protein
MERIKCTKNFYQDEFVFEGGDFNLMDSKIIVVAQWLRDTLGKSVTINNYATGGQYHESGLRSLTTTTGAKKSAHKEGKAIDIKVAGMSAKEVYDWCLDHQMELYSMGVREIEDQRYTATWVHLSTRGNHLAIKIIRP